MDFVQAVQALVSERISRQAGGIQILSDSSRVIVHPLIKAVSKRKQDGWPGVLTSPKG